MRGNHIQLGRQDYTEPAAIDQADIELVRKYRLTLKAGSRLWRDVFLGKTLIGSVATYLSGQVYRPVGFATGEYLYAAQDWNSADPPYASAILHLRLHEISVD